MLLRAEIAPMAHSHSRCRCVQRTVLSQNEVIVMLLLRIYEISILLTIQLFKLKIWYNANFYTMNEFTLYMYTYVMCSFALCSYNVEKNASLDYINCC